MATSARAADATAARGGAATERTVWVKKDGDANFTKLRSSAVDIDDLKEEIVKKLGITERLGILTLHVTKDKGNTLGAALDSDKTVAAAGLEDGTGVVIKLAGATPGASVAGEP